MDSQSIDSQDFGETRTFPSVPEPLACFSCSLQATHSPSIPGFKKNVPASEPGDF